MHIVLITRNRLALLSQTLGTMGKNAVNEHCLSVVVDQPADQEVIDYLREFEKEVKGSFKLKINDRQLGVGGSKNLGASLQGFDENFLMFSDDDMYYLPEWDMVMEHALGHYGVAVVGGCQHPFHQPMTTMTWNDRIQFRYVDATAGYCMGMRRGIWEHYGPFDSSSVGVGRSEDWALCQRARKDKRQVAYVHPPIALHCGLTNCEGQPCTGAEEIRAFNEKLIEERKLEGVVML